MNRVFVLSIIVFLALCKTDTQSATDDLEAKEEKKYLDRLFRELNKNSVAYKELEEISKMGNRMTGTENGKLAEEYVFQKLIDYGYQPEYHNFPINSWTRENASLRIGVNNRWEDVNTISFSYTPINSHLTGKIVDLGNGKPSDYKRMEKEIPGNIVMVNLHIWNTIKRVPQPNRHSRVDAAIKHGAKGVILINRYPGEILTTGTVSYTDKLVKNPVICISRRDGKRIREFLQRGEDVSANIQIKNNYEPTSARTVVAKLPGTKKPNERVLLGGHIDTWDISSGAMDNGIGSFAILDIARAMKKIDLKPARTIQFMFWMGEEQGLVGSRAYLKEMHETGEIDSIFYYINIDLDGNPMGLNVQGWENLIQPIKAYGERIKSYKSDYKNMIINKYTGGSDNIPFAVAGIPVLRMVRNVSGEKLKYYHSNKDNFYLIEESHIHNSSIVMGMVTYLIANSRDIDVKRLNVEETKEFYRKNKMPQASDLDHWSLRQKLEAEREKEKAKKEELKSKKK